VPFQENAYFNVGPEERTQNVLNIQPVIPISINDDWNIITRTLSRDRQRAPGERRSFET
jgi:hypothetical protein